MLGAVGSFVWSRLGHCSLCMRKGLLGCIAAWLVVCAATTVRSLTWILPGLLAVALFLTVLTVAHFVAYAVKKARRDRGDLAVEPALLRRRAALRTFGRSLLSGFFVATLPVFAGGSCVCYCGGQSWSPGSTACQGGQKTRCSDRPAASGTNCGWDNTGNACDGGENCRG